MVTKDAVGIETIVADYGIGAHARAIVELLDGYARSPMGGGVPLEARVRDRLAAELAGRPGAFSVLCFVDDEPAGLANCFEGFSTFKCRPLVNVHDIAVAERFQGRGISQLLLEKVDEVARQCGCCKITLEVLEDNRVAQGAYRKYGFEAYRLGERGGRALFWQKVLDGE